MPDSVQDAFGWANQAARRAGFRAAIVAVALGAGATAAAAQGRDDLRRLSDEFNTAGRLAGWRWHHDVEGWSSKVKRIDVSRAEPGRLTIEPWPSVWYFDYAAPFLFKAVRGDFMVTARVRVTGTRSAYPATLYSLGGIMVRRPHADAPYERESSGQTGREDYVFLATGTTNQPGAPYIETKSATSSKPSVRHYPLASTGWVELRLARLGRSFVLLDRVDRGAWTVRERIDRPDLSPTLQVGIMAYGDFGTIERRYWYHPWDYNRRVIRDGAEDLRVEVDWIRFTRIAQSGDAAALATARATGWADSAITTSQVTDLLPFLVR